MKSIFAVLLIHVSYYVTMVTSQNPQPQEVLLPMCRNLVPYTHTVLPNSLGHQTQAQVSWHLNPLWRFMDEGCSVNLRLFLCSLYLPPYNNATGAVSAPCRRTCMRARNKCRKYMQRSGVGWSRDWRCRNFPRRRQDQTCVNALSERRRRNEHRFVFCERNTVTQCAGLPAVLSNYTLPNRFLQLVPEEVANEVSYYDNLLASQCSEKLQFFLCGTMMPFCLDRNPFANPCREVCEDVYSSCAGAFNDLYNGLPWPSKLQCHRYANQSEGSCVMYEEFYPSVQANIIADVGSLPGNA